MEARHATSCKGALQTGNSVCQQSAGNHAVGAKLGIADRTIRFVLGLVFLDPRTLPDAVDRWLGLPGKVPLLAGAASRCPLGTVRGIRTCPVAKSVN
jgi:hypothetical protein